MQEKQSAVLKLLASGSSQASKPNSDVVLVAGDCRHMCISGLHSFCISIGQCHNCNKWSSLKSEVVCVAGSGATGGVGTRVVQTLLQQGKAVRALVRNEQKARALLVSYIE